MFSNLGSSGSATIASSSASCSAMPRSNAGAKWSSVMSANGGRPYGSVLGSKKGLSTPRPKPWG